jgi:hypothetical protein
MKQSWSETLGVAPATEPKTTPPNEAKPSGGGSWAQTLGVAPSSSQAKSKATPSPQDTARMDRAMKLFEKGGMHPFGSVDAVMAMVDLALVGQATFGEKELAWNGRDVLKKRVQVPGMRDAMAAVEEFLTEYFGPTALSAFREARAGIERPLQERLKGVAIPEALPFQAVLENLPDVIRAGGYLLGRQIPMAISGDQGKEDWRANLEEIDKISGTIPATRAADGVARVLQYFVPYIGQSTAASDFTRTFDRAIEVGIPKAFEEEILGTLKGLNVIEPGIGWDERIIRAAGLAVAGFGVAHGAGRAKAVYDGYRNLDLSKRIDPFGFGKMITESMDLAFRDDPYLRLLIDGETTPMTTRMKQKPDEVIQRVNEAAKNAESKMVQAADVLIAQGGPEAAFWTKVQERHSSEPDRTILDIAREESARPEWNDLSAVQKDGSDTDIEQPFKRLKESTEGFIKDYNRKRNQLVEGVERLRAGESAIWANAEGDQPVTLRGFAGEKDGKRYWLIEGADTGIPESELKPTKPLGGKNVSPDDITLAKNRAQPESRIRGEEANSIAQPRSWPELEKVLYNRFMIPAKQAESAAMIYGARAETWAEATGANPSDWFETRLAGFADKNTVINVRELSPMIKYSDEDGVLTEARLIELEGGKATVEDRGGSQVILDRERIVEGIAPGRTSYPRLETTALDRRTDRTIIDVNTEDGTKRYELSGEAKTKYEAKETEYRSTVVRVKDRQMGGVAALRKAGAEFAKFKRELTGALSSREYKAMVDESGALAAGQRVKTPLGTGQSLGIDFGRVRVRLDGEDAKIEKFGLAEVEPELAVSTATGGVRQLSQEDMKTFETSGHYLGVQSANPQVKGYADFLSNGRAIIRAFGSADVSTFLHELAHVMRRELYDSPEFSKAEIANIEEWAGVTNGRWSRAADEKWANAFEKYFMTEKAPTRVLSKAFRRIKAWMLKVYSKVEGSRLDVDISPEVRKTFDKMLGRDVESAKAQRESAERESLETELKRQESEEAELMMLDPGDPRLDPFADELDADLVLEIKNKLGYGPDDIRNTREIIEDARRSFYEKESMQEMDAIFRSDQESGLSPIAWINDILNGKMVDGKRKKEGAAESLNMVSKSGDKMIIDGRNKVDFLMLDGWPETLLNSARWFLDNRYRGPEYWVMSDSRVADIRRGDKPSQRLTTTEYMEQEWGEKAVVTRDFLQKWKESLSTTGEKDTDRLYQKEDFEDSERGGMSEINFNATVDDMTFWAAEVLTEVEGNIEQLKKLLRKEYQLDALQTLEIVRRIDELPPIPRIVEAYQEFGGSYKAITQMLLEEFPDLPKARFGQTIERALRVNGLRQATVPSMRMDKKTKKREPVPFKDILVIGAEDILVPADVTEGLSTWSNRLSKIPTSENTGRFLERIAGRNHEILDFLVTNRQEAVTNLTNHRQKYRETLQQVYGPLLKDKEARAYIMFYGEGKGPHTDPNTLKLYQPVAAKIVENALRNSDLHKWMKERVKGEGGSWDDFTKQKTSEAFEAFARMVDDSEFNRQVVQLTQDLQNNQRAFSKLVDLAGVQTVSELYEKIGQTKRREFNLEDLKSARPSDWEQIVEIADWHRAEYDVLYKGVNDVRVRFGLGEIPYRRDYMTHMAEEAATWKRLMGLDAFKGKRGDYIRRKSVFNRHALTRTGEKTVYDSLENFEGYLDTSLRQVHLTEPTVRHRAVARIIQRRDIEGQWADVAKYIDGAANALAGQVVGLNIGDLIGNQRVGKVIENGIMAANSQVGRNSVLGNLQTAVMQTGQLAIAAAMVGPQNMMSGVMARMGSIMKKGIDPSQQSQFLTRRYGFEGNLALDWIEQYNKFLSIPMNFVEEHTVRAIWTGAHLQAGKAGKSHAEAIKYADKMTERIVGGRAIGEQSPLFQSSMGKLLLQFQYEVSNFNQLLKHDLNYDELAGRQLTRKETMARAAVMMVSIYAMNWVYELMFNRRPLPDVIETGIDMANIAADPDTEGKAWRLMARAVGEGLSATAGGSFAGSLIDEQKPILGTGLNKRELFGDTEFGTFSGGAPTLGAIKRATSGETFAETAWNLSTILGLPGGGSQIRKTVEGTQTVASGKRTDKSGKTQFEVSGLDSVRALLFGPWGTRAAKEWLEKKREKQE